MSGAPRTPAWAGQLDGDTFSWRVAMGGWRGAVESVAPALVFVVAFVATRGLRLPLVAAGALAVAFCLVRLAQRQALTQALSGALGVGVGVAWAALSGRGQDYFAGGLVSAAAFALVLLVSLAARRPLAGTVLALVWHLPEGWRADARQAPLRRRSRTVTWVWAAMFLVRLGVQWPLWHAGEVAALGVAKLLLGLPLFGVVCWVTWVALRPFAPEAVGAADTGPDTGPDEGGAGGPTPGGAAPGRG